MKRKWRPGVMAHGAPVLIVHGATLCASLFDLPLAGYSLMAALADSGRVVYALDVRGYGHSLGPGVMDEPPHCNPPFADADSAVEDIAAAADFVLAQQQTSNLDLIGFSWGAITASRFAGAQADKVARLALYAPIFSAMRPIWPNATARDAGEEPRLEAYRLVSEADIVARWDAELPATAASQFRDDAVPCALFDAVAALDPRSKSCDPPAFRCPNGAIKDLMQVFAGKRAFDPGKLTMPVLLVRGEQDLTSTEVDARKLLSLIPSPAKRYRVIAPGSHFLCVERNREMLYEELIRFFDEKGSEY